MHAIFLNVELASHNVEHVFPDTTPLYSCSHLLRYNKLLETNYN